MPRSIPSEEELQPDDARIVDYDPSEELPPSLDAGVMEHYLDVGTSSLRHDTLNDPKYEGARISRQQLSDEDDDEEDGFSSEGEEDMDVPEPLPKASSKRPSASKQLPPSSVAPSNGDENSTLRMVSTDDREKGKAVIHQIAMWDALLDARIRLQKALTATNSLPLSSDFPDIAESSPAAQSLKVMLEEATALSRELSHLQESISQLDNTFPSTSSSPQADPDTDFEAQINALSLAESSREASQHPALVTTLSKWSSKIQAAQPSFLLPAKSSFKNAWNKEENNRPPGVIQVIQNDLNDSERLLSRTRIVRSGKSTGTITQEDGSSDVFDDTDFYQQLLRDVIDTRAGGVAEESWVARQLERKARKKANVDTKASKGRKLRYQVHEKIQHFMVPIPVVQGGWHEEQIDDLFLSLAKYDGEVVY
ncbi:hypothetical protein QCA50_005868 [Cerrena zonata]|uniref:Protein BFR2 n=1 Tax=Cerrena zonata TaxID=2478898 RepID=A0AAW0GHX6_9APHY